MSRLQSFVVLSVHLVVAFGEWRSVFAFRISYGAPFSILEVTGSRSLIEPATRSLNVEDSAFRGALCHAGSATALWSELEAPIERTSSAWSSDAKALRMDNLIQDLLDMARNMGPVGIRNSVEDQEKIQNLVTLLRQRTLEDNDSSALNFTNVALTGVHDLVYSAAPGGSSGKIGPFDGKVTQTFVNATTFINAVDLGPLRIALTASRKIKDETTIAVRFHSTTVSFFGIPIVTKAVGGGGIWNILYTGVVHDMNDTEHPKRLLRVMQTPSLFIIEQKI
jgi:hypothetical protein